MQFAKRIFERGIFTVPEEIREVLDIEQGDLIEFSVLRVMRRKPREAIADAIG